MMPSRILLVDDDAAELLALSELLQRHIEDAVVETALDVHAALDLLRYAQYHVIVSDIRMVGLDGLALLNQVRERWPEVPVILITAAGRDREAEGMQLGAYAFLEKPLDWDLVVSAVRAAIERARLDVRMRQTVKEALTHLQLEAERLDFPVDPSLEDPKP